MRTPRQTVGGDAAQAQVDRSEVRRLTSRLPWRIGQRTESDGELGWEFDGTSTDTDAVGGVPADELVSTDGLPPGSSPTPSVLGGLRFLAVQFEPIANDGPVTYEYHVSETTDFTPDATTLVTESRDWIKFIRNLADGTPLAYGTTYYVKIVAKDADGAAAASAQDSAQLDPAGTDDILAASVTAAKLAAELVLASVIKTAASGGRIEISEDGILGYKPDGTTTWLEFNADGTDAVVEAIIRAIGVRLNMATGLSGDPTESIEWQHSSGEVTGKLWSGGSAGGGFLNLEAYLDGTTLNYIRILSAAISGGPAAQVALDDSGGGTIFGPAQVSSFLQLAGVPEYCSLERMSAAVNIPNTAAHTGSSINVSLPGLEVGDWCFCLGNDGAGDPRQFHFYTNPVCTVADQITLQFFNADASARDPASFTFYFLALHLTSPI